MAGFIPDTWVMLYSAMRRALISVPILLNAATRSVPFSGVNAIKELDAHGRVFGSWRIHDLMLYNYITEPSTWMEKELERFPVKWFHMTGNRSKGLGAGRGHWRNIECWRFAGPWRRLRKRCS